MRAGFARRHARACCPQTTTRGVFGRSSARTAGRAASPRTLSAAGFSREGRFRGDSACLPMASRPTHPGGRDPMKRSRMPARRAKRRPGDLSPRSPPPDGHGPESATAPKPVDCPGEGARCRAAVGEGWKGQMPVRGRVEPKGAGGGPATDPRAAIRTWLIGIAVALAIAWTLRQTVWIALPLSVALFIASAYGPSVAGSGSAYPGGSNSSATPPPWRSSCRCYPCSSRPSGTPRIASSPSSHATPTA